MTAALDLALPAPHSWIQSRTFSAMADNALKRVAQYEGYEAAITPLNRCEPALSSGLYNHAPMVVEALFALGQGKQAPAWLHANKSDATPHSAPGTPIDEAHWQRALGQPDRYADWKALFEDQLEQHDWRQVLSIWTERLERGFTSSALHAALQTAHAVRPLIQSDTRIRRQTLASALAAWASRHRALPVHTPMPQGSRPMKAVWDSLTPLAKEHAPGQGMITAGYLALSHAEHFADELAQTRLQGVPLDQFDVLMDLLAAFFLDQVRDRFSAIVFTHALTGTAAARTLASQLPEPSQWRLLHRAFEASAGLKVAFTPYSDSLPPLKRPDFNPRLVEDAIATGDDHAIKLTEAMVSTYKRTKSPILLSVSAQITEISRSTTD